MVARWSGKVNRITDRKSENGHSCEFRTKGINDIIAIKNAEFIVKMAVLYRADVIVPFVKAMLRRMSPNARRQSGKYYGKQKKRPVELIVEKTI